MEMIAPKTDCDLTTACRFVVDGGDHGASGGMLMAAYGSVYGPWCLRDQVALFPNPAAVVVQWSLRIDSHVDNGDSTSRKLHDDGAWSAKKAVS